MQNRIEGASEKTKFFRGSLREKLVLEVSITEGFFSKRFSRRLENLFFDSGLARVRRWYCFKFVDFWTNFKFFCSRKF